MEKHLIHLTIALAAGAAASLAHADGPVTDYDHSRPAVARTLSPDEYLVNADGAQEDPANRMSDVARAYRNGMIAGRKEALAKQQASDLPPLPPGMGVAQVKQPPILQRQLYTYAERPVAEQQPQAQVQAPQYAQYSEAPEAQPVRSAPATQYVAQQNVYVPQQAYVDREEPPVVEAYSPPPPPVYAAPMTRYVYVQPPPPPRMMMARQAMYERMPPRRYWQRDYQVGPDGRYYAYQPY